MPGLMSSLISKMMENNDTTYDGASDLDSSLYMVSEVER